jgi:hypothetical protein
MVKAKFNGNAGNPRYQCAEFNARFGNTVTMPNARWTAIGAEGKQTLFTLISSDAAAFPAQTTVGPK